MRSQTFKRGHGLVDQHRPPRAPHAIAFDDFHTKRLFAFEVVVERAFWNARDFGDFLDADAVESLLEQGLQSCLDDFFLGVMLSHGLFNMTGRLESQARWR